MHHYRRDCYHESGHVVAGWNLGFRVESVRVGMADGQTTGQTAGQCVMDLDRTGPLFFRGTRRQHESLNRHVQTLLAGQTAFNLFCSKRYNCDPLPPADFPAYYRFGAQSDLIRAIERILPTLAPAESVESRIAAAEQRTRERLNRLWPAVESIAAALEQRGSLTGAEVRTLIRQSLAR